MPIRRVIIANPRRLGARRYRGEQYLVMCVMAGVFADCLKPRAGRWMAGSDGDVKRAKVFAISRDAFDSARRMLFFSRGSRSWLSSLRIAYDTASLAVRAVPL